MTPEDIQFVREIRANLCREGHCGDSDDKRRLLSLLIAAEAEKENAEFWGKRPFNRKEKPEQVNWSDSDWVRSVRERWGLE